jgi:hypothetical protein
MNEEAAFTPVVATRSREHDWTGRYRIKHGHVNVVNFDDRIPMFAEPLEELNCLGASGFDNIIWLRILTPE